jgi:cytochrome b pre-mRNA-processing protein 3
LPSLAAGANLIHPLLADVKETAEHMSAWKLFKTDPMLGPARGVYAAIIAQARNPVFYEIGGVPDSIDGRFEMATLHSFLVLRRLRQLGAPAEALSQALVDTFFADMDASLREMGAGDLGVGKRVKGLATAFYGRVAAYESAASADELAQALQRNLFGTVSPTPPQLRAMVQYAGAARGALAGQSLNEFLAARLAFPAPDYRDQPAKAISDEVP